VAVRPISILRGFACLQLLLAFPFTAGSQEPNQGFLSVRQILAANCAACHDWTGSHQGIADPARVTPGAPDKSPLYTQVASDAMPMGGEPLPVTQKNLLRAWIAAGATASEEPLSLELPEAAGAGAAAAPLPAAEPSPVRRFNKLKFHQVSGFTSASLFLAAGVVGAIQWGTFIADAHAYRDSLGIDEFENNPVCTAYIIDLWNDPMHQALRWTHAGLITTGEGFYLYNAATGIGMIRKGRAPLSAQAIHRYGFFIHGSLMLAQIIMGLFTTEVLSTGNHEAMVGLAFAHTAVGFAIPVVMIGSGIAVRRMLKL
jgi:mono/diheme cytochrome c family protein